MDHPPTADLDRGEEAERHGDFLTADAAYRAALDDPDPAVAADARWRLGRVAWRQGRFDEALSRFEQARDLALARQDDELRARAETGIGNVHYAHGAYSQARAAYRVALGLTTDALMRAKVTLNLGVIANIEGQLDEAQAHYQRSRIAFAGVGDRAGEAMALQNLGMLYADRRQWDEAEQAYRDCLALAEAAGNRQMIANVLCERSEVRCGRGRYEEAIAACDHALTVFAEIGDAIGRGEALRWRGHAQRELGQFENAERTLTEAIGIARHGRVALLEAEATRELAATLVAAGNRAEGVRRYERARDLFTSLGAERDVAEVRAALAALQAAPAG